MSIELNEYGFCMDSDWFYVALDWKVIIISAVLIIGIKLWKGRK
jgi:hypothetical protein